jgi:hypothetical protein
MGHGVGVTRIVPVLLPENEARADGRLDLRGVPAPSVRKPTVAYWAQCRPPTYLRLRALNARMRADVQKSWQTCCKRFVHQG